VLTVLVTWTTRNHKHCRAAAKSAASANSLSGYLDQISHATVGRWSMLTGLISSGLTCCPCGQRHRRNVTILTKFSYFMGAVVPIPFTTHTRACVCVPLPMRAKFGVLKQTCGLCFRAKFHLDQFLLSLSGGEKPQILTFLGFGIL